MNENAAALVLKVDGGGLVRTPAWKREEIVAAYEARGMTGRQFAASCGVKYSTLMSWASKSRKRKSAGREAAVGGRWVEAVVGPESRREDEALAVEIGSSVRLRVVNFRQAELAGEILRALGVAGRC